MNDDERLWDDEALLARENQPRKGPSALQRMPPRLLAAMILAGIVGAILLLPFPYPPVVLVSMFAAGIAGALYVPMALRHSSFVVIPAAVTGFAITVSMFFVAGLAMNASQEARSVPSPFLLSALFAPFFLVGTILWATIVRSWEDRLFTTDVRDAARRGGANDYALIGGWAAVAVVWTVVSITQL